MQIVFNGCHILFSAENKKKKYFTLLPAENFYEQANCYEEFIHFQGRQPKIGFCLLLKGVCSKGKEFAPLWSKFFPFKVDSFSERTSCVEEQTGPSGSKHC